MTPADEVRIGVPAIAAPAWNWPALAKRSLDVIVAVLCLTSLCWLFALIALLIVLDSRGPALFRQERIGRRGRPFTILKFRSMYIDTDPGLHREYVSAFIRGEAKGQADDGRPVYKLVHDARVTRVGNLLRRTSLDELPQLWNVLRGEMSLVGPRPSLAYEVALYPVRYADRLAVRPGITGLWQVVGRSTATFEEMMAMDLDYVRRQSLLLDVKVLLLTLPAVCSRRGAH